MKTILVIDDVKDNLIAIKAVIKANLSNSKILTALSGKKGIKTAQEEQPDTILLDINMPEMDGYEVCKRLKVSELTKYIPIIIVTAIKTDSKSRIRGLNSGADAFLSKPIEENELMAQLNVMLRIKYAEDKLRLEKEQIKDKLDESEKKYEALYRNAPLPYHSLDEDGFFIEINPAWLSTLGYKRNEVIGKYYGDFLHPDFKQHFKNKFPEFKRKGNVNTTFKIRHKNGSYIDISLNGSIGYLSDGSFKQTNCVFQDITDRKQAEEKLKVSEERFKVVAESAEEWIWEVNAEGLYTYSSPLTEKILGYTPEEIVGKKHFYDIFHEDVKEQLKEGALNTFKEKQVFKDFESTCVHKNGQLVILNTTGSPVLNKEGNLIGYHGAASDITERKQVEDQLIKAKEKAEESEGKLRIITNNLPIVISQIDANLQYLFANQYYYERSLFEGGIIGENMIDVMGEETFNRAFPHIQKVLSGEFVCFENRTTHTKNNELIIIETHYIPHIVNGQVKSFFVLGMDITERKRIENESVKVAKEWQVTFDSSNDSIWLLDKEQRIIRSNKISEKLFKQNNEKLLGEFCWSIVHGTSKPIPECPLKRASKSLQRESMELFINNKWFNITVDPIIDVNGEFNGAVHIIRDINDQKKIIESLEKSRIEYKSLFNHIADPIIVFDQTTKKILDCNTAMIDKYGYTFDELLKMTPLDLHHPEDDIKRAKINIDDKESISPNEYKHVGKDGSLYYIQSHTQQIKSINGDAWISVMRDITDRKLVEEKIQRFSRIFEDSLNEIFLFDSESLKFIQVNDSALKNLGFTMDEFLNMTPVSIKPEITDKLFSKMIEPLRNKEEDKIVFETIHQRKDQSCYNVEVHLQLMQFENENVFVAIILDITQRKQAEIEIAKALKMATESDRLKSAFLATMSHELRTPLNAVIGFSDIIDENVPIKDIVHYGKTINNSGNHLLKIVEDLFDITLIEAGEVNISMKKINLIELLQEVRQIISIEQQKQKKSHIDFNLSILENHNDLVINTDPVKLKQILINLLKNALKFTHVGHIICGFEIETNKKDQWIKFFIEDSGIGISKEKHVAIFEAFGQVEDTYTRTYGGTGIGLSLSKKLTEILGGEIWLESELDKGSTFYFTIPLTKLEYAKILDKSKFEEVNKETNNLENKTVLVVEDDDASYDFLEILLGNLGIITLKAQDGVEAIKRCKEESTIDLVLMDINMPVMNGFNATKEIKKFRPELPIIAQTAYAIAGDKEKSLNAGCDDYISKPIKHEVLMEKLNKYL